MSSGLFNVVELDDPETLTSAARTMWESYAGAETSMGYTAQCWSPMAEQYVAPEAPVVHSAMETPTNEVGELAEASFSARTALNTYAETLEELGRQRATLIADIADFEAQDHEDSSGSRGEVEDKIEGLQTRCHQLAQAKDQAQNDCAQSLRTITTTVSAVRGSEHPSNIYTTANEAGDLPNPEESFASPSNLAEGAGLTPGDSFGHPGADGAAWAAGTGLTAVGVHSSVVTQTRTGRSAGARNVPRRTGVRGTAATLAQRTAQNYRHGAITNNNSRVERLHHTRAERRATAASRAGGVLTGVTAGFAQWNEDSKRHPDMGTGEQLTRAGVSGGTTAGGAALGAKGGAAAGAAIGSLAGPAGTVVGGVVGGIAGGIAGSELGSALGDGVNNMMSSLFGD